MLFETLNSALRNALLVITELSMSESKHKRKSSSKSKDKDDDDDRKESKEIKKSRKKAEKVRF